MTFTVLVAAATQPRLPVAYHQGRESRDSDLFCFILPSALTSKP